MTLADFFHENPNIALCYSGGVDSSYLLYAALKYGAAVQAYYVRSAFQPEFEYRDALKLSSELGAKLKTIDVDVLSNTQISSNPADRCYYCKKSIMTAIASAAAKDGFSLLIDGTNASDQVDDRPGMRALQELSVRSPLRECNIKKADIRTLSRKAHLFTWNKPAYACLATRIPTGEQITEDKLARTEKAESFLFSIGLTDFRIRMFNGAARLQVPASQIDIVMQNRVRILENLKQYYSAVLLDFETRN